MRDGKTYKVGAAAAFSAPVAVSRGPVVRVDSWPASMVGSTFAVGSGASVMVDSVKISIVPPEALGEACVAARTVDGSVALTGPLVSKRPVAVAKAPASVVSDTVTVAAGDMASPVPAKTVTVDRYAVVTWTSTGWSRAIASWALCPGGRRAPTAVAAKSRAPRRVVPSIIVDEEDGSGGELDCQAASGMRPEKLIAIKPCEETSVGNA